MAGGYEVRNFPEKSWSISKMKVIESCLREYYYTYYGSHNGWLYESTDEQKISWRLKKLTNIWLMFGDKLHLLMRELIKYKGAIKDEEKIKIYMRNQLNLAVKSSLEKYKSGEWDEYPRGEMLQEYYYGDKLSDNTIEEIKKRIEFCSRGILKSRSYKAISNKNLKILEVDEGKFDYIIISGVKVYALIDFLYVDEEGNYVIVDWKTGKESEYDKEQLMVYALYVMERYKVPLDKIIGRVEYLLYEDSVDYRFTKEDEIDIKNRIDLDLNVINAFLEDKEINRPRPKEDFLKCDNLKKCSRCKFKKICLEEI
ncbi:MAG: PD-(D/E)XK nuclease family protein [Clostridium sp.]|nr:PD-(D/E)XK nuclease family protein [Clostridium sp.]